MDMAFSQSAAMLLSLANIVGSHLLEVPPEVFQRWLRLIQVDEPVEYQGEKTRLMDARYFLHNNRDLYMPIRVQVVNVTTEVGEQWKGKQASMMVGGHHFHCNFDPETGAIIPKISWGEFPYKNLKGKKTL